MQIQWLGLAAFKIQTKNSVIVTNPYADSTGLKMPKLKADIVMTTDAESALSNNLNRLSGDGFIIDGPGEYEIGGTFAYGLNGGNTVYVIEDEGITIAFLGALDTDLTNTQLETIEGVDILLLPVGTLNKEQRTVIISQVEPRVIIPYLFKQPKIKEKFSPLEDFLKEMGIKKAEFDTKYSIKKNDLPQEEAKVILLASTS